MMYYLLLERPVESLASIGTMLAGLGVYALSMAAARNRATTES
jgi:hypothetical protein